MAQEAARKDFLVTFGIKPTRPETGFGYLKVGNSIPDLVPSSPPIRKVEKFVEKPDLERAEEYLTSGEYFWNSGIFVWKASAILQEMKDCLPELHRGLNQIGPFLSLADQSEAIAELYSRIDPVSIDYGVMEKSAHAVMLEADIGWHDVGSWNALDEICDRDEAGNIKSGNLLDLGSQNSILLAGSRVLATAGLRDMVAADTPGRHPGLLQGTGTEGQGAGRRAQEKGTGGTSHSPDRPSSLGSVYRARKGGGV